MAASSYLPQPHNIKEIDMGARIVNIFVLVAIGAMLANAIAHPSGTKAIFDGIGSIWKTSINGILGKSS